MRICKEHEYSSEKGAIFVELVDMAEKAFGEDVVDDVLDKADLD
ncbi:hypothetical protein [Sulfitobacter sp.]